MSTTLNLYEYNLDLRIEGPIICMFVIVIYTIYKLIADLGKLSSISCKLS